MSGGVEGAGSSRMTRSASGERQSTMGNPSGRPESEDREAPVATQESHLEPRLMDQARLFLFPTEVEVNYLDLQPRRSPSPGDKPRSGGRLPGWDAAPGAGSAGRDRRCEHPCR